MSHDLYTTWAEIALVKQLKLKPEDCFEEEQIRSDEFDIFVNRENGKKWPIPDGRLTASYGKRKFEIALEMKTTKEGVHGLLTAIGQAQAYIHPERGYTASIILIPDSYKTHESPGEYIAQVINNLNSKIPIGVYSYSWPDHSNISPFEGKLRCHRPLSMSIKSVEKNKSLPNKKTTNQWAHLREGSSEPDIFFKYLQIAKKLAVNQCEGCEGCEECEECCFKLNNELVEAAKKLRPDIDPYKYLSSTNNDSFHDRVWRIFWYKYILSEEMSTLFQKEESKYITVDVASKLTQFSRNEFKKYFSGQTNSKKDILCYQLNNNELTESEAWMSFSKNVYDRAHSLREDVDSGLAHLGLLESDGKPSELGYRFVDACERTGNTFSGSSKKIFGAALLKNGDLIALLYYFHKLSEQKFHANNLAFTTIQEDGNVKFDKNEYLAWIKSQLVEELKVMTTSTSRGGSTKRKIFQAEIVMLRKFNFIKSSESYRVGVGLVIDWPLVQEYLEYDLT